ARCEYVGTASDTAGLLVDRDDRHDQAVLGQMAPIAQHLVADLAGLRIVDEDAPPRRFARNPPPPFVEVEEVAVLGQQDFGLRRPAGEDAARNPRVLRQLAVLA